MYIIKRHATFTDTPPIRTYDVNNIESSVTTRIKTRFYLERLTPETMKLPRATRSKVNKDENGENIPHLEITKVVLDHCNIASNDY